MAAESEKKSKIISRVEAEFFVQRAGYVCEFGKQLLRSSCVDGRYSDEAAENRPLARPGGDAGDYLVLLAALRRSPAVEQLGINVDSLRSVAVRAAVAAAGGVKEFHFHTDDHHLGIGAGRGCGHLAQTEKEPAAYGLLPTDIEYLFSALEDLKRSGGKETVLYGGHAESGVFIIRDEGLGMRRTAGGRQAFVFQEALHRRRLAEVTEYFLTAAGISVPRGEFQQLVEDISCFQTKETLRRLAAGLPIYAVGRRHGIIRVEPQGVVGA